MTLHTDRLTTLSSLEQFLAGTAGLDPQPAATSEAGRQAHVLAVLRQFHATRARAHKGLVLRYLRHTSGYSRQHLTRLIARYRERVPLGQHKPPTRGFNQRYTEADVVNLAKLDAVHENLSGPARTSASTPRRVRPTPGQVATRLVLSYNITCMEVTA